MLRTIPLGPPFLKKKKKKKSRKVHASAGAPLGFGILATVRGYVPRHDSTNSDARQRYAAAAGLR